LPNTLKVESASNSFGAIKLESHDDDGVEVELVLSTHRAVVVRVRNVSESASGARQEQGLVIARRFCQDDRPRRSALINAAREHAMATATARAGPAQTRLQACIGGVWRDLLGAGSMPSAAVG